MRTRHVRASRMAALACAVASSTISVFGAYAVPDSLTGKVYRSTLLIPSIRTASERTILFESADRFVYLMDAGLFTVAEAFAEGRMLLREPRSDGSYVYTKIDEFTARMVLHFDDGSDPLQLGLLFSTPTGGVSPTDTPFPNFSYSLTDRASLANGTVANISTRGVVLPGHPMIVGFIVPGTPGPQTGNRITSPEANRREVLVRAVGPSLIQFGVQGVWADPEFALHDADGPALVGEFYFRDWTLVPRPGGETPIPWLPNPAGVAAFQKIFAHVGAFPLLDASKEAATVVRLAPGAYTVVASTAPDDPGGEALVEVYFLP